MRASAYILLSAICGILTNIVSAWIDAQYVLSGNHPDLALLVFGAVLVLLIFLEHATGVPGGLEFHRFWYLVDLLRSRTLSQWGTRFATLHLGKGPRYVPSVHVIAEGERHDLVSFLFHAVVKRDDNARHILILGEPGCGKSTAMQRLMLQFAVHSARRLGCGGVMPLLIRASDFEVGDDFERLVVKAIQPWALGRTRTILSSPAAVSWIAARCRLVLLIDAVDEIRGEQRLGLLKVLSRVSTTAGYEHLAVIITCRTRQDPDQALPHFGTLSILELDDAAVRRFVEVYCRDDERDFTQTLRQLHYGDFLESGGLARNPFWLRELIRAGAHHRARSSILSVACQRALTQEFTKVKIADRTWTPLEGVSQESFVDLCMDGIGKIAVGLGFDRDVPRSTAQARLRSWLKGRHAKLGGPVIQPDEILEAARDAKIFGPCRDPIGFSHRIVQEFFIARGHCDDRAALNDNLIGWIADSTCWPTLALHAGMLPSDQCDVFVRRILRSESDTTHALACALSVFVGANHLSSSPLRRELLSTLAAALTTGESLDVQLRESVRQFLAKGHEAAVRFLSNLLTDSDPHVRCRICSILAMSESDEAVRVLLLTAMTDSTTDVVNEAAESLAGLGTRAVWPVIRELAWGSDNAQRVAATILARLRASEAVNFLMQSDLSDHDVAAALNACATRRVGRLLIANAQVERPREQRAAALALAGMQDERAKRVASSMDDQSAKA